jgi:hypothetical protein
MMKAGSRSIVAVSVVCALIGCSRIDSFSPEAGLPGTIVEINGVGFAAAPFDNEVTIGGSKARIIGGSATQLRVVALRDLASGKVEVETPSQTITSSTDFRRQGSTESATPERDADAELYQGFPMPPDRVFDLQRSGLNQKVLVILAKPSDVNPDDPMYNAPGKTARERVQDALTDPTSSVNAYFTQASFNQISGAFTITPDWVALSQKRDFLRLAAGGHRPRTGRRGCRAGGAGCLEPRSERDGGRHRRCRRRAGEEEGGPAAGAERPSHLAAGGLPVGRGAPRGESGGAELRRLH